MMRPVLFAVLLLQPACSRCQGGSSGPLAVTHDEPRLIVGFEGTPWKEDPVTLHAFEVLEKGFCTAGTYSDVIRRERAFPAVSVSGTVLYLARGAYLERYEPLEPAAEPVIAELEDVPASLLCTGQTCLVGLESRVDHVDFGRRKPKVRTIHEEDLFPKPVDFLVRSDGLIVAVDDEVMPKYAFVLELSASSRARYLYTTGLPSGPNETYMDAIAVDGTLVITAQYGIMEGSGNTLYRWKIGRDPERSSRLKEFFPEDPTGMKTRLVAGEENTLWNGLGAIDRHVFIGAGKRGILHMELGDEQALLHDVGGPVADLLVLSGRIIALVGQGGGERCGDGHAVALVILTWNAKDGSFTEMGHHCHEAVLHRIAY
ncbi:MAG: hypothetical protein JRG91_03250 [Deltaproteobacteria bacterium]|nr:hypothetical protein [Deltaproteobacteria bacterium]